MSIIIDISEWQGTVDIKAAKEKIAGVIARCSYGWGNTNQIDKQFANNAKQANDLGIPLGAYHFAYARNAAEAKEEAKLALTAIKGYKVRVLYYDMEYSAFQGNLTAEKAYEIAKAFCDKIEAAGIPVGIYANENWFRTKLTADGFKAWTLWLANYGSNNGQDNWGGKLQYNPFGNVLLHQFTSLAKNGVLKDIQGIPSAGLDASTDHGWLATWNKDYVYGSEATQPPKGESPTTDSNVNYKYKVGDTVTFKYLFASSTSDKPLAALISSGRITAILAGKKNPYLVNGGSGWLNDAYITNTQGQATSGFTKGQKVKVKSGVGAKWKTGQSIPDFVFGTVYSIIEMQSEYAVIGINGAVTGAIHTSFIYHV